MNSYELLTQIFDRNIWLEVEGDGIRVSHIAELTKEEKELIVEKKIELIALLESHRRLGVKCSVCSWTGYTFNGLCAFHFDIQVRLDKESASCTQAPITNLNSHRMKKQKASSVARSTSAKSLF